VKRTLFQEVKQSKRKIRLWGEIEDPVGMAVNCSETKLRRRDNEWLQTCSEINVIIIINNK
jgi:hypothetical protein